MMNRKHLLYLLIALSLLLVSCAPSGHSVNFDEAIDANGSYVFPGLEWGITQEQVEGIIKYSIGTPFEGTGSTYMCVDGKSHTNETFLPDEHYVLHGNHGDISFQFIDKKLVNVSLGFVINDTPEKRNNDPVGLYVALSQEMKNQFGEPVVEIENEKIEMPGITLEGVEIEIPSRSFEKSSCNWEGTGDTRMSISFSKGSTSQSVSIGFACIDFPRAVAP